VELDAPAPDAAEAFDNPSGTEVFRRTINGRLRDEML